MSQLIVPEVNYAKLAGDVKSQIVNLTAMLLDIPRDHPSYLKLATARGALEEGYAALRATVVPERMR